MLRIWEVEELRRVILAVLFPKRSSPEVRALNSVNSVPTCPLRRRGSGAQRRPAARARLMGPKARSQSAAASSFCVLRSASLRDMNVMFPYIRRRGVRIDKSFNSFRSRSVRIPAVAQPIDGRLRTRASGPFFRQLS